MTKKPEELLDSLVRNAIDFLRQSVKDLLDTPSNPKYSVINFYSSVELFLKARLMAENWILIYSEIGDADEVKFATGNLSSANFIEIIKRLKIFANVEISKSAFNSFDKLRKHRNKLIHFFHPEYAQPNKTTIEYVVAEQYKGWHHLYRLLTKDWKDVFSLYIEDIKELNSSLSQLRPFLQSKYESVLPEIEKEITRGTTYLTCESCNFLSKKVIRRKKDLSETFCMVCESQDKYLIVQCPQCQQDIFVYELGEGFCENCETEVDLEYLFSVFVREEETRAYCSDCEYTAQPTVIQIKEDKWLCLYCLSFHQEIGRCEWCSELVTGDIYNTCFKGCVLCEGRDSVDD